MDNSTAESAGDIDLGSGAIMLLPDVRNNAGQVLHLAVGAGKDQNLYVLNRDSMGKFDSGVVHQQQRSDRGARAGLGHGSAARDALSGIEGIDRFKKPKFHL
jgi:GTP cyclohydrolase III